MPEAPIQATGPPRDESTERGNEASTIEIQSEQTGAAMFRPDRVQRRPFSVWVANAGISAASLLHW